MSTEDEKQSLDDAIERLEAEHKRRIDEKIERGEAIRVPALSVVVGVPDEADGALEDMRARMLAADRLGRREGDRGLF
jgi:hypothetical protein